MIIGTATIANDTECMNKALNDKLKTLLNIVDNKNMKQHVTNVTGNIRRNRHI
jgi:hypothetical protein